MNNPSIRAWGRLLAAAALLQLAGCASFDYAKAAPPQQRPVALQLSGQELSGATDLPLGVYRVPDSQVIIFGHQRGQGAGLLFGLVGVAIAHAANAGSGADAVKSAEQQLHLKLDAPVLAAFREITTQADTAGAFTLDEGAGGNRLVVTPGLVLSFVSDADVRAFVVLKVSLAGAEAKPAWTTRYIASTAAPRPLLGPDSWLAQDGAALREAVATDVRLALHTLADDVRHLFARDENKLTMLQGPFPHIKQRLQTVGFLLREDDRYVTFVPRLGDAVVFSGVNIFSRQSVVFRPATEKDERFKLLP